MSDYKKQQFFLLTSCYSEDCRQKGNWYTPVKKYDVYQALKM